MGGGRTLLSMRWDKHKRFTNGVCRFVGAVLLCIWLGVTAPHPMIAAELEDGMYSVNYMMHQANNDSVSIANDYFEKPANLIVHKGKHTIEFTVKQSEWVKELQVARADSFVDVPAINEDREANERTVAFAVDSDLDEPILLKMHVLIESMEPQYDHRYSVRMQLEPSSLEKTGEVPSRYMDEAGQEERSTNGFLYVYVLASLVLIGLIVIVLKQRRSKT